MSREKALFQKIILWWHLCFTLFVILRASGNPTSQNIGRTDAWAVPHLKFWWGTVTPTSQVTAHVLISVYVCILWFIVHVPVCLSLSISPLQVPLSFYLCECISAWAFVCVSPDHLLYGSVFSELPVHWRSRDSKLKQNINFYVPRIQHSTFSSQFFSPPPHISSLFFLCLSVSLYLCLSVICLSVCICMSIWQYLLLSSWLSVCLCLSVCLSLSIVSVLSLSCMVNAPFFVLLSQSLHLSFCLSFSSIVCFLSHQNTPMRI